MIRYPSFNHLLFPNDHKKDHFKALDGLRGLAVLFVILSHTSLDKLYVLPMLSFENIGKIGVFLFFILSAYLLDRQIIIGFVSNKANYRFWANYFLRRFLRIYPLYIAALFVFFAASKFSGTSPIKSLQDISDHVLLLKGDGIFWSIVVEFKYYFLSPLLMAFCNYVLDWNFIKVSLFLSVLVIGSVYYENAYDLNEISVLRYMPFFLTGTFLSIFEVIYLRKQAMEYKKNNLIEISGMLAGLLIIITIPSLFNFVFQLNIKSWYFHNPIFYLPYALLWSLVLLASKYGKFRILKKMFEVKALRFLGVISFSMYLFHIPVLKIVELSKLHINRNVQFYVFLFAASFLSLLSYLLIERHLQKVRIRYENFGSNISLRRKNKIIVVEEKTSVTG